MVRKNVLILGAAGRDFHTFNTLYRDNDAYRVVAFTATQIPHIDGRRYPAALAGDLYPEGIPIVDQAELPRLIRDESIDECIFAYSDVSYDTVMHLSSLVQAAGASFVLPGPRACMLPSHKPVIAVTAVRTGCGKSQTARAIVERLMAQGLRVVAIRHPMPYGDLEAQRVQRFAQLNDLELHQCTIEEMEEYEPHIVRGNVIYAGVDYGAILAAAENDPDGCDLILWDGGNNDFSFYKPDLHIVVVDPHRVGHEQAYYPSEVNLRSADVVVINKIDSADAADIDTLRRHIGALAPKALVIDAASPLRVADPSLLRGKKVLAVEDGPTLTHGGMRLGAATLAAAKYGATLVDPRPYLKGELKGTFAQYPEIGALLPAMGYGEQQLRDLEATIRATPCDAVVIGTPIDLQRVLNIRQPATRVFYDLQEIGQPTLDEVLEPFVQRHLPLVAG
ncbi:MAG: GTPase [Bacteroidetes bacterium]|nr:MAG: GTPase [Bacteroidota bacterium]